MRYLALVTDYDGTLATGGRVPDEAVTALRRLRRSGRRSVMVTGRRLEDLQRVCPHLDAFDSVVVENGAVIYVPQTREITALDKPPPRAFVERLGALGVPDIELGQVIVATRLPYHTMALQAIQELGLELLITFNESAVMVLPPGVNKSTGLDYALRKLGLSFHEAVGVGNAENDHSFLSRCECAVAVANAVPPIKKLAAFVTGEAAGRGVVQLIDELVANDLSALHGQMPRNRIVIGSRADGAPVTIPPYGLNVLVAGPSGSGKSTVTAGIVERLVERAYQVCIIDPEGDYGTLQEVITLGSQNHPVSLSEGLAILEDPKVNLNINLLGVKLVDRPQYVSHLLPSLNVLRARTGRPHWIVLDEAHHLLPAEWERLPGAFPHKLSEVVLATVHPDHLPPPILSMVDVVIAVGPSPERTMRSFASACGRELRWPEGLAHKQGEIIIWLVRPDEPPFAARSIPPTRDRIRHRRKYAEGNMRDRSFYFRGPGNRHNLKAHNLAIFSQIAEGIDEETWLYHLRRGDYSVWFRHSVKDPYLAYHAQRIEQQRELPPFEARTLIRSLIESRYTLPA